MPEPKGRPTEEFARFHALTKKVVSVPKREIDRRAKEHRARRKETKQAGK